VTKEPQHNAPLMKMLGFVPHPNLRAMALVWFDASIRSSGLLVQDAAHIGCADDRRRISSAANDTLRSSAHPNNSRIYGLNLDRFILAFGASAISFGTPKRFVSLDLKSGEFIPEFAPNNDFCAASILSLSLSE